MKATLRICLAIALIHSAHAATITVTNTNDALAGSLRQAIQDAAPDDTIAFSLPNRSIITLTSGPLVIAKNLTITGPGANLLTVQRSTASGTAEFQLFVVATGNFNVTISGLTIAGGNVVGLSNTGLFPPSWGGGIQSTSTGMLTVTGCTISGNTAILGGGIANLNTGALSVSGCTFNNNVTTQSDGGGVYNNMTGAVNVTNSTFTGNSSVGNAGGIFNSSGILTVSDCTITGNSCGSFGGGIANYHTLILKNSIVALNTALDNDGPDIGGSVTSQGYNLIGNNNAATIAPPNQTGDQIGTPASPIDPKLDPKGLQDNGGPTLTIALQAGSPAINTGDPAAPPRDQRNYVRQDVPDIGAFEFAATIPVTLANISTRGLVGTGDSVMIGGFIVTGTGTKSVLVRAIGPSLSNPPFNLSNVLPDPILSLFDSTGMKIAANDNWAEATNSASIDPNLRPTNGLESAILITLNPGAYTAIVRGVNGGTGLALVEVYDLNSTVASKLANISTRGLVGTGDDVMIGGFIVKGPDNENVVVRAIGPSLSNPPFNIANALPNPTLSLFDGNGIRIASNDDWRSTQQAAIIATGLQPSNDLESAIVITLIPGNYTAIVTGVGGTIGVALVEVYSLN